MTGPKPEQDFDLIVVGGGPGGSTLGAFVAMQGHRVLLLERDNMPRYQIGESLLPSTIHGIGGLLGIREQLQKSGFTRKNGGTFRWGTNPEPWTFAFASALTDDFGYAYQVERSKFDKLLLDNARQRGVDVRERHAVEAFLMDGERVSGVRFKDESGEPRTARARFVADCSGNQSRLASRIGERSYSKFFQNIALFGYYENGKRLAAPNDGNILCAAFKDGWFWYIPLSPTLTSVGAVISREHAHKIEGGHEQALDAFIQSCPIIRDQLTGAKRVTEGMYGQVRIRKDYSYSSSRFWAPGAVLIGDAACFVDPVFSSGVHLATYSALLAARSINTSLRGTLDEKRCFEEFERRYRREYGNFYEFLIAFYDMNHEQDSYFWQARKVLNTEDRANDAFIRLVAGVSFSAEPAFGGEQYFQQRIDIGESFQRFSDGPLRGQFVDSAPQGFDIGGFLQKKLTSESMQLQLQSYLGARRPAEQPVFEGGLSTSQDGFHWVDTAG